MERTKAGFASIDAYIATFPEDVQAKLEAMRAAIRAAAPDAVEKISYQMPAFVLNGTLVHFAAWKHHIGLYPVSSGISAFDDELAAYSRTKGAIHFPLDQPLPLDLITRIVAMRVQENRAAAAAQSRTP